MRKLRLKPEQAGDCPILETMGEFVIIDADGECWTKRQLSLVKKVTHGAAGLAKAVMGIDRAPDTVITERRKLCVVCPEYVSNGLLSKCSKCGCNLQAKTTLASEACPLGKW